MLIHLGDRVKDRITGFKGVVVGITNWLNGCVRVGIHQEKIKAGQEIRTEWIDDVQLEVLKRRVMAPVMPGPSGPRKDAKRAMDPTR